jgi:cell division protein FtsQ
MSFDQTLPRTRGRRRPLSAARARRTGGARFLRPRLLLAIALLAALLGGGWLLLRDSSLVAVRTVTVSGPSTSAEPRIRAALEAAGHSMTTLHVRDGDLQRAVAGFPSVAAIQVRTDFPHRLMIDVLERRPVAALAAGDQLLATTGSGLLLRDIDPPADVPEIRVGAVPAGPRVTDPRLLGAIAVAAAAPPGLLARTTDIEWGTRGLIARLASGPPLIFGAGTDAAAKWAGAARVLADPSAAGATYLDLRIPGRVAAGGLGPVVDQAPADSATNPLPVPTMTPTPTPSTVG